MPTTYNRGPCGCCGLCDCDTSNVYRLVWSFTGCVGCFNGTYDMVWSSGCTWIDDIGSPCGASAQAILTHNAAGGPTVLRVQGSSISWWGVVALGNYWSSDFTCSSGGVFVPRTDLPLSTSCGICGTCNWPASVTVTKL